MNTLLVKKVKTAAGLEADVLAENGVIVRVGKSIRQKAKKTIDGRGLAILPGFFNLHTHAAMTLLRGYAEDMALQEWLEKKIWPKESKFTAQDIFWGTKLAAFEMIKSGTVFFNDMYWFPEAAMEAVKEAGIGALLGLTMLDGHLFGSREAVEKSWRELKDKQTDKVKLAIAPHAVYSVSPENLKWAGEFARKNKLPLHLHLSETKKEVADCLKKHRCRPTELLDKLGVLGPKTILAHGVWLDEKELKILARRKCRLVFNPVSNMKLGSGIPALDKWKKAGVDFCLGTDSASSNNNLDMMEEMKVGTIWQKSAGVQTIKAKDIFKAATAGGARAGGLKSGIIKEGNRADFILVNARRLDLLPGFDLISDLVYSASSECVETVVCGGEILMEDRRVKGEEDLIKNIIKRYKK